ncbi:MAG: ABC transporter permease [Methylobacter sp.]|nr:ABC transporter permease [Methylobacter sp.]
MVVLWTDALIYLLLVVMLGLGLYLRGKEHIKRPLQKICRSKIGMVSLVVLLFFVLIGLLDSIHFKPADDKKNEIISVLDNWATPLREHGEKTYSSPFATTLYSKEMMLQADGSMQWGYPRLEFGGKHLEDTETQKIPDILQKTAYGFFQGIALTSLLMLIIVSMLRRGNEVQVAPAAGEGSSTKAVWLTLFIIIPVATILIHLSTHYHVFGTDKVGEDVFYQAVKSIRTGLVIGTLTTLIMLPMDVYTTLNSIPGVLLIAASILMVQVYMANHEAAFTSVIVRSDMRLLFLCMILGVTSWTGLCRLLRAETLKLREMEYVQAATALGVKKTTILMRHILPNVMHIVLISVVLDFSSLVLAEAVLSYINIGVDPTSYSWGNMINGARLEMAREPVVWWSLSAAFVFMFALVLAANLFADVVQDAFDPRRSGNE